MHDVGVALDEHQVLHLDAPEVGDAAEVVAAEVDEHDVFGDFFGIGAKVGLEGAVGSASSASRRRVPAMGRYSTLRPLTRTSKLGRGADDVAQGLVAAGLFPMVRRRRSTELGKRRKYMYGEGLTMRRER